MRMTLGESGWLFNINAAIDACYPISLWCYCLSFGGRASVGSSGRKHLLNAATQFENDTRKDPRKETLMSRKFISSIMIAAIAATSLSFSAAPAKANDDLAKFLVGATALVIIGKAISDNNRNNQPSRAYTSHRPDPQPKKVRKPRRYALTAACVRRHNTYDGKVKVFGQKCLQRHYHYADSLPRHCKVRLATTKGTKRGYSIPCLRNEGYYIVSSK